jgi:Zn-dependent M28 family amino/carboxypeptidase
MPASAQTIQFKKLNIETLEARLKQPPLKNKDRKTALQEFFLESGCKEGQFQEQPIKGEKLPNLICTLPGELDSIIIVGAHYDSAGHGQGAVDNWSGAALLPSLFESLSAVSRHHTYVFVGFYGEEEGLIGSEFYVKQIPKDRLSKIAAMINMDCLGLTSTKVEENRSDRRLLNILANLANQFKLPIAGVNVDQVGITDSYSFLRRKVPVVSFHSVTQQNLRVLHSNWDTFKAINMSDYYDTYRLITLYLAALDVTLN